MRSEFQYFMNDLDHSEFDELVLSYPEITIRKSNSYDEIAFKDGFIQYERSEFVNGILTSGRISIASRGLDGEPNYSSIDEIERLYKELRKWLKNQSTNKLVCFNEKVGESTLKPVKNFWLCKGAAAMADTQHIKLKQFVSTNAVFKLA